MATHEKDMKEKPETHPATRTAPADPKAQPKDDGPAREFSTTAAAEQVRPTAPRTVEPKDKAAAEKKLEPLQKDYDATLEAIRQTPDPLARAALVHKKGNITREMDAIRRPARLPNP